MVSAPFRVRRARISARTPGNRHNRPKTSVKRTHDSARTWCRRPTVATIRSLQGWSVPKRETMPRRREALRAPNGVFAS